MMMFYLACFVNNFYILLFGAKLGFGGSIDAASLLEFVDSGHDLIMAADASYSELIREIAVECGVDFDEVKVRVTFRLSSFYLCSCYYLQCSFHENVFMFCMV